MHADGFVLTTTEVAQNKEYWKYAFTHSWSYVHDMDPTGKGMLLQLAQRQATMDTGWLVCKDCAAKFQFDHVAAKARVVETIADPNRMYGPAQYSGLVLLAATAAWDELYADKGTANIPYSASRSEPSIIAKLNDFISNGISPAVKKAIVIVAVLAVAIGGTSYGLRAKQLSDAKKANAMNGYSQEWVYKAATSVSASAISPDGKTVAVAEYSSVKLLDGAAGKMILAGTDFDVRGVTSLCFSPDGNKLAAVDYIGAIRQFDVPSLKQIGSYDDENTIAIPHDLAFTDAGKRIFYRISGDMTVLDSASLSVLGGYSFGTKISYALELFGLCPDGRSIIVHLKGGRYVLWDTVTFKTRQIPGVVGVEDNNGNEMVQFTQDMDVVYWIDRSEKGRLVATQFPSGNSGGSTALPGYDPESGYAVLNERGTARFIIMDGAAPTLLDFQTGLVSRLEPSISGKYAETSQLPPTDDNGDLLVVDYLGNVSFWKKLR